MLRRAQDSGVIGTFFTFLDRDGSIMPSIDVYVSNEHKARATDLELFGYLKAFSWLSDSDKTNLISALGT